VYAVGAGSGGTLVAVDEQTGALRWTAGAGGTDGSVAVSNGVVYVDAPCDLLAFDAVSGALSWSLSASCTGGGGWAPSVYASKSCDRDASVRHCGSDQSARVRGGGRAREFPEARVRGA